MNNFYLYNIQGELVLTSYIQSKKQVLSVRNFSITSMLVLAIRKIISVSNKNVIFLNVFILGKTR